MLASEPGLTQCGGMTFRWGKKTYIMGIINVSADSFSGDGLSDVGAAVARAKQMVEEGADIIDVGGESTRPGSSPISVDEELSRVIPVMEKLRGVISLPLSVDTYKLKVAQNALDAGADMINDIWGLKLEPKLAELAARKGVPIILMSNQRDISPHHDITFPDVMSLVIADLRQATQKALSLGVPEESIIVDPGPGFGKTQEQNLEILRRLEELKTLGLPVLIGTSRKSFIGYVLDLPAEERLEGTAATVAIAISKGADIVRVSDVREMARVCKMTDAIVRK
ncbi:MAG: dihydropteroate synthase [Chloroflexota bacterium]|nr:dihydropteroate synthase [Chloroflexota bacterium]